MTETTDSRYGVFAEDRTGRLGPWHPSYEAALTAAGQLEGSAYGATARVIVRSALDPRFNTLPDLHADVLFLLRRRAAAYHSQEPMTFRKRHLRQTLLAKARRLAEQLGVPSETIAEATKQRA